MANKPKRRRRPESILADIAADETVAPTARVMAARALLNHRRQTAAAKSKPSQLKKAAEVEVADDPITKRALQIAAERQRSLN